MLSVNFFEKPGCITNAKQKKLLRRAGVEIIAKDLLTHGWSKEELLSFLADTPVTAWFNQNAPAIKLKQVQPESLSEQQALKELIDDPILIRRPLIDVNGHKMCGFQTDILANLLGLPLATLDGSNMESCSNPVTEQSDLPTCGDKA